MEGYCKYPSQEKGRVSNSNVAISQVEPVLTSRRPSSSDRHILHETPSVIPLNITENQCSRWIQHHHGEISRNTRSQSVRRENTPELENQLPFMSPDFNSTQFFKILHCLESADDKMYLKLIHNMVTLLRVSYRLNGRNYQFPLDHCTISVIPNMANSLLLFPPDALQMDSSLTDLIKISNIEFLLTLIKRRMSSIQCSELIKMDLEDITDEWKQMKISYFGVLSSLDVVLRKTIKHLL